MTTPQCQTALHCWAALHSRGSVTQRLRSCLYILARARPPAFPDACFSEPRVRFASLPPEFRGRHLLVGPNAEAKVGEAASRGLVRQQILECLERRAILAGPGKYEIEMLLAHGQEAEAGLASDC